MKEHLYDGSIRNRIRNENFKDSYVIENFAGVFFYDVKWLDEQIVRLVASHSEIWLAKI